MPRVLRQPPQQLRQLLRLVEVRDVGQHVGVPQPDPRRQGGDRLAVVRAQPRAAATGALQRDGKQVANRVTVGISGGRDRSRGRYATPADFAL